MEYERFLREIEEKAERITRVSDLIWDAAETAFSEYKTVGYLVELLKEEGFQVEENRYGMETAFTGACGYGKPVIGFLGEFDALANLSQKADVMRKEAIRPGENGHGCGHNMLGAGALAAAISVKRYLEERKAGGTVIFFGCPGEEGGSGKAFMAREGAFDHLDFALTWHPGEINAVVQESSLANIQVLYKFSGISAHAAACPELGRSALDAVELMNVGANFLREHMISDARLHYAILNTGGVSPNVVQNYAEVLYLIRAPRMDQVQQLYARVNKVAEGMALATETTMEYEFIKSCSDVIPNLVLERELYKSLLEVPAPQYSEEELQYAAAFTKTSGLSEKTTLQYKKEQLLSPVNRKYLEDRKNEPLFNFVVPYEEEHILYVKAGSTDVGDVSWKCPTAQINTATWAPNSGGHSWQIVAQGKGRIAHKGLLYAGKVMALTAMRLLENPQIMEEAKMEFRQRMQNKTYIPIPAVIKPRPMKQLG